MKHGDMVSCLTLEEKCALLSGKDVWHTRPMDMAKDILFMVNGHFFRGCGRLIHHFFHRPKLQLKQEA